MQDNAKKAPCGAPTGYRQNFTLSTAFKQASTSKRHDATVVMPVVCLWADCEVFGST